MLLKRLFLHPKPCLRTLCVPRSRDLKNQFEKLNVRDRNIELVSLRRELVEWDALQDHIGCITQTTNMELLRELSYMSVMYSRPLSSERKINGRNILYRLFNETKDEGEQKVIFQVITYYGLLE